MRLTAFTESTPVSGRAARALSLGTTQSIRSRSKNCSTAGSRCSRSSSRTIIDRVSGIAARSFSISSLVRVHNQQIFRNGLHAFQTSGSTSPRRSPWRRCRSQGVSATRLGSYQPRWCPLETKLRPSRINQMNFASGKASASTGVASERRFAVSQYIRPSIAGDREARSSATRSEVGTSP